MADPFLSTSSDNTTKASSRSTGNISTTDSYTTELITLFHGLQLVNLRGITPLVIELDALEVINMLSRPIPRYNIADFNCANWVIHMYYIHTGNRTKLLTRFLNMVAYI
uniref:Uncharacterized protein isoform X1 n=2 Tax=Nicotiana TaxID=4085 RepID=A0A1S4BQ27_TOBAC|nr:PREDICTED: uncharacterized protein LOC104233168 isoform X1 [Nicotiana sylvestris]XP_016490913.1 PREDICTED: uncharacterized protein LOC107810638 isoform X1 [Nicotiana tabacum]